MELEQAKSLAQTWREIENCHRGLGCKSKCRQGQIEECPLICKYNELQRASKSEQ